MKLSNNKNKISILVLSYVILLGAVLVFSFKTIGQDSSLSEENYTIIRTQEKPKVLNEISALSGLEMDSQACVQEEDGIIFIYILTENRVEVTVNFAKSGDYEAITVVGTTAYVLRSDGAFFEIPNYLKNNFDVKMYETPFSETNDIKSLSHDRGNNRLLLIPNEKDLGNNDYCSVYAFNLQSKKLEPNPVLKIKYSNSIFDNKKESENKKPSNSIILQILAFIL